MTEINIISQDMPDFNFIDLNHDEMEDVITRMRADIIAVDPTDRETIQDIPGRTKKPARGRNKQEEGKGTEDNSTGEDGRGDSRGDGRDSTIYSKNSLIWTRDDIRVMIGTAALNEYVSALDTSIDIAELMIKKIVDLNTKITALRPGINEFGRGLVNSQIVPISHPHVNKHPSNKTIIGKLENQKIDAFGITFDNRIKYIQEFENRRAKIFREVMLPVGATLYAVGLRIYAPAIVNSYEMFLYDELTTANMSSSAFRCDFVNCGEIEPLAREFMLYISRPVIQGVGAGTRGTQYFDILFYKLDSGALIATLDRIYKYQVRLYRHIFNSGAASALYSAALARTLIDPLAAIREASRGRMLAPLENTRDDKSHSRAIAQITSAGKHAEEFIARIESILNKSYSRENTSAFINDLSSDDMLQNYYIGQIIGYDADYIKGVYARKTEAENLRAYAAGISFKQIREQLQINIYKSIIAQKFGPDRLAGVEKTMLTAPHKYQFAANMLNVLSKTEKKIIEYEYEQRGKLAALSKNNNCAHVRMMRKYLQSMRIGGDIIRNGVSAQELAEFVREIDKFMPKNPKNTGIYPCRVCGFDLICPHLYAKYTGTIRKYNAMKMRQILEPFSAPETVGDNYYCGICSEILYDYGKYNILDDAPSKAEMDEELRGQMWIEMSPIFYEITYLKMSNTNQIINAAIDVCYPYIAEYDFQLAKSKTTSEELTRYKLQLYMHIFARAYAINLVLSNDNLYFSKLPKTSKEAPALIKYNIDQTISQKNIELHKIGGTATENVKFMLLTAYKQLTGNQYKITFKDPREILFRNIIIDPIFHYIVYAMEAGARFPNIYRPRNALIEKYLGTTADMVRDGVYANARKELAVKEIARPSISDIVAGKSTAEFRNNLYNHIYNSIWWKLDKKLRNHNIFIQVSEDTYAIHEAYRGILERLGRISADEKYITLAALFRRPHANYYRVQKNARQYIARDAPYSTVYDSNGLEHRWNIIVYSVDDVEHSASDRGNISSNISSNGKKPSASAKSGAAEPLEAKLDDFRKMRAADFHKYRILDKKCGVCGAYASKPSGQDEEIRAALIRKSAQDAFVRFYEYRCPESGKTHEYKNSACIYCGLIKGASLPPEYYKKYTDIYEKEKTEIYDISEPESSAGKSKISAESAPEPETTIKFIADFNIIKNFCIRYKININIFMAIGAMEKQNIADIESGKYIPPEPKFINNARTGAIHSHIQYVIQKYNMLRNYSKFGAPPRDITEFLTNSQFSKSEYRNLETLPDIAGGFREMANRLIMDGKPRNYITFLLQTLAEKLSAIGEMKISIAAAFAEKLVADILAAEYTTTKYGYFNWSTLYPSSEIATVDINVDDADADAEADDENIGDIDDADNEAGVDSRAAFKGIAELDIDDVDADDDETINDIRVGEDLGLS